MKCIRLAIAIAILGTAKLLAGAIAGPALDITPRSPLHPAERMLLGSLVGVFIAGLWIWISARAGR